MSGKDQLSAAQIYCRFTLNKAHEVAKLRVEASGSVHRGAHAQTGHNERVGLVINDSWQAFEAPLLKCQLAPLRRA